MPKLKLQYFGHLMWRVDSLEKTLMLGGIGGRRRRGQQRMRCPSLTQWTWVWVNSGSWWWTGRPGVLRFMKSQRVRHYSVTELNWKFQRQDIVIASSVQFSHSVVSDSLRPHGLQHARPSPTPRVHSNSCPLSQSYHPTISSSVITFFSLLQSFQASGSFQMSQLFASGGQSIGASASTSVLPMNTQDWSPLGWTGWISLQSKGLSRVFCNITVQKHQLFGNQLSL